MEAKRLQVEQVERPRPMAIEPEALEEEPTPSEREELRTQLVGETPGWYSPAGHLLGPSVFGLTVCVLAGFGLESVLWWEWFTIPAGWVFANFVEWHAHRDLLHTRQWWMPVLYERHTPTHHRIFLAHDMAVRDRKEWRQVLMPAYAVALIVAALFPVTAAIWFAGLPNVALFYLLTGTGYVLMYEWLHLSYHLAPETWVGRRRLIRYLRRHHAVHHTPRLMRRWNMNVTIPFWDRIRGTIVDEETAADVLRPR